MRVLGRLVAEKRIAHQPQVIFLDSAHEIDETLLELKQAWQLLAPGGVLIGDDFTWDAVRHDVSRFVATVETDKELMDQIKVAYHARAAVEKYDKQLPHVDTFNRQYACSAQYSATGNYLTCSKNGGLWVLAKPKDAPLLDANSRELNPNRFSRRKHPAAANEAAALH